MVYANYEAFLDKELNSAYQLVCATLPEEQPLELQQSQRDWLKFRDSEFALISNNWSRENYGTSSAVSRGQYRCSIIESRVKQVLRYAQSTE